MDYKKKDIISILNTFCETNTIKSTDIITSKDKILYHHFKKLCHNIKPYLKKDNIKKEHKKKKDKDDIKKVKIRSYISNISNDNSLDKFADYKKLIKYFKDIALKTNNCITLTNENNKYLLTDDIKLYEQIGSPSVFGIVYKAKNINDTYNSIPKFVAKIQLQTKEAKNELVLFKKISTNAVKNNLLHIPLYYYDLTCNLIIKTKAYPKILQDAKKNNKNYSIILYELAEGDLMSFINKNTAIVKT